MAANNRVPSFEELAHEAPAPEPSTIPTPAELAARIKRAETQKAASRGSVWPASDGKAISPRLRVAATSRDEKPVKPSRRR